jgi:FMN phosphatase YigB (HAD superfamily)
LVLQKLSESDTPWGIVSNGSSLQLDVVRAVGLDLLTDTILISSIAGYRKPDKAIFELAASGVSPNTPLSNILFVGDNPPADIVGAADAGMRTAWVTRGREWQLSDTKPSISVELVGDLLGHFGSN